MCSQLRRCFPPAEVEKLTEDLEAELKYKIKEPVNRDADGHLNGKVEKLENKIEAHNLRFLVF